MKVILIASIITMFVSFALAWTHGNPNGGAGNCLGDDAGGCIGDGAGGVVIAQ